MRMKRALPIIRLLGLCGFESFCYRVSGLAVTGVTRKGRAVVTNPIRIQEGEERMGGWAGLVVRRASRGVAS